MAFCCNECKIIYSKNSSNCPKCGGQIINVQSSDESLLQQGFLYHKNHPSSSASNTSSNNISKAPVFSIDSQDALEQLRQDFINHRKENKPETPQQPTPDNKPSDSSGGSGNSGNSFFSNVSSPEYQIKPVNPAPKPVSPPPPAQGSTPQQPTAADRPFSGEQETPLQRRVRTYRPTAPIQIPWRIILYIFLAIVAIIALVAIWNARYTIINSILDFILSLLPIALIIGGMVYLVRRLFR